MKLKGKKICIFDFDGTIVDSMEAFADVAADVIYEQYGTPKDLARRQYIETSGIPFFQQLEIIHPGNKFNFKASELFEKRKLANYFEASLVEGVKETASWLTKNGILVAVSSNNFQHLVDEFVEKRGLGFDFVLGYRENFAKGRDHFNFILNSANLKKAEMVFVGDSIKDGERAVNFGIDFICKIGIFTREEFKRNFPTAPIIRELLELKEIIEAYGVRLKA